MDLRLIILKFHPLLNWSLKGIPRGVYPIYKMWKSENPEATEKELSIALFNRRFSTTFFESSTQEKARIKNYFNTYPEPENLVDMCTASAMIEFKIPPENSETHEFIENTTSIELCKMGYR